MLKKTIKLLILISLLIICSFGIASSNRTIKTTEPKDETINSIVNLALENVELKIYDYVDVNYFTNLKENTLLMINEIESLDRKVSNEEINDINIDEVQYEELTSSITNIFNDLSDEEYDVFKKLSKNDSNIAEMLELVENNFETPNSDISRATNVITLSTGILTISSILSAQQVNSAAIVAIKGAFNAMVATVKAFFVPNSIKAIVITSAILVISTVVIINWNKIKPVFNQLVNVFVENAKKLASTVIKVFSSIQVLASESEPQKDYADDATSTNQMQKQVERGQAPKEVDRVDKAHTPYGQDHVHFKDKTAINKDGTVHDDGHGVPKLSKKVLEWLNRNGWCLNGVKNR